MTRHLLGAVLIAAVYFLIVFIGVPLVILEIAHFKRRQK